MKIQVTEDDIARGIKSDCKFCPIAIAVKRATHQRIGVFVQSHAVYFLRPDVMQKPFHASYLPLEVENWINDFDEGKKEMQPIEFELETPHELL